MPRTESCVLTLSPTIRSGSAFVLLWVHSFDSLATSSFAGVRVSRVCSDKCSRACVSFVFMCFSCAAWGMFFKPVCSVTPNTTICATRLPMEIMLHVDRGQRDPKEPNNSSSCFDVVECIPNNSRRRHRAVNFDARALFAEDQRWSLLWSSVTNLSGLAEKLT